MRLVSKIPLLVMTLIASGCMSGDLGEMFKGAPPIVADVSESSTVPNAEFTAHLRERYPIGSEEAVLIATLREQHFNFTARQGHLSLEHDRLFDLRLC